MKTIIPITLVLLLTGCVKEKNFCGYKDPINEVEWLQEYENDPYIVHYEVYESVYKDTAGFYVTCYFDSARTNGGGTFRNCNGEHICKWGGIMPPSCPNYSQHETHRKLIYSK
jgi:hypothetical protein